MRDYHIRKRRDLRLDPYFSKGVIAIVSDLLDWTFSYSLTVGQRRRIHPRTLSLEYTQVT